MEIRNVDDLRILELIDVIICIIVIVICGFDLYFYYYGEVVLEKGYVVGYEFMGIVEEVGL